MTPPLDKARGLIPDKKLVFQHPLESDDGVAKQRLYAQGWNDCIDAFIDSYARLIYESYPEAKEFGWTYTYECGGVMRYIALKEARALLSRTDLHALVAEVERLRSLLGEASEYLHDVPKESADGDSCASLARRIRAELSTAPPQVTDAMVEAACAAFSDYWGTMSPGGNVLARKSMRKALQAALAARGG